MTLRAWHQEPLPQPTTGMHSTLRALRKRSLAREYGLKSRLEPSGSLHASRPSPASVDC